MNKKLTKRIFCLFLSLVLLFSVVSGMNFETFAAEKGTQSYSNNAYGGAARCQTNLNMYNASIVSGNNITYVVDKKYYSDMSSLGNVYSVEFIANAVKASTSIVCSSSTYSISDTGVSNDVFLTTNPSSNGPGYTTHSGCINGPLPEIGETAEFTITSNIYVTYAASGYPIFNDSCSNTVNVKIITVDTTDLSQLIVNTSKLYESCWTSDSWSGFSTAQTNANNVAKDVTATQSQIDSAYEALSAAKVALVHDGSIMACSYCSGNNSEGGGAITPIAHKNIQYGSNPDRQVLDLYLPSNTKGDISLILFIHGGAWLFGSKEDFTNEAYEACKKYGIATAAISYRYASLGSVNYNDILNDVEAATLKIKEYAKEQDFNIEKMMTHGFSAGAHLSLMYAYTRQNSSSIKPVCVYSNSGPAYLLNGEYLTLSSDLGVAISSVSGVIYNESTKSNILVQQAVMNASPVNYINSNCPPTIICHGVQDSIVPYSEGLILNAYLNDAGVEHSFITFPNSNHGCGSDPDCKAVADEIYDEYVNKYLLDVDTEIVHNYVATVTEKTCTTDGYTTYTCSDCGRYYISDYQVAGHTPGEWEIITPATTTTEGEKVKKCTVCQEIVETQVIEKIKEFKAKENSPVTIDETDMTIVGVPQGTTDISEYFETDGYELEYIETSAGFGTGTVVNVKTNGEIYKTYTIVISGDVTGDGYVDSFDTAQASYYVNSFEEPESNITMKATDMCNDGYLDASDLAYIIYIANYME